MINNVLFNVVLLLYNHHNASDNNGQNYCYVEFAGSFTSESLQLSCPFVISPLLISPSTSTGLFTLSSVSWSSLCVPWLAMASGVILASFQLTSVWRPQLEQSPMYDEKLPIIWWPLAIPYCTLASCRASVSFSSLQIWQQRPKYSTALS